MTSNTTATTARPRHHMADELAEAETKIGDALARGATTAEAEAVARIRTATTLHAGRSATEWAAEATARLQWHTMRVAEAVASVAEHPIAPFLRAGFNVSVNTDNRLMSHVLPSTEMFAVAEASVKVRPFMDPLPCTRPLRSADTGAVIR